MEALKFLLSSDILELVTEPVEPFVEPVSIGSTSGLQVIIIIRLYYNYLKVEG